MARANHFSGDGVEEDGCFSLFDSGLDSGFDSGLDSLLDSVFESDFAFEPLAGRDLPPRP
jgi:hypothetical protein